MSTLKTAKLRLLRLHLDNKCGHLGGNISSFDAIMTLHHFFLKPDDRFLLSKGHSAGSLYVTLWSLGLLDDEELDTFSAEGTLLPAHPSGTGVPNMLFPTGSLGHGPSLTAGMALAAKHSKSERQVYCFCSDGEWQEGACWEALTFAVHHKLNNLTYLIDQNGLQGFGKTKDIISCDDLTSRIDAFGAHVQKVDGHDFRAIKSALDNRSESGVNVLILDTIKGKGLPFEGALESHYLPISEDEYNSASKKLMQE